MKVNLKEIKEKILSLLENKESRESVTSWAVERRNLFDESQLEFEPIKHEDAIWEALMFLSAADLKISPTEYFHEMSEFKDYSNQLKELEE